MCHSKGWHRRTLIEKTLSSPLSPTLQRVDLSRLSFIIIFVGFHGNSYGREPLYKGNCVPFQRLTSKNPYREEKKKPTLLESSLQVLFCNIIVLSSKNYLRCELAQHRHTDESLTQQQRLPTLLSGIHQINDHSRLSIRHTHALDFCTIQQGLIHINRWLFNLKSWI